MKELVRIFSDLAIYAGRKTFSFKELAAAAKRTKCEDWKAEFDKMCESGEIEADYKGNSYTLAKGFEYLDRRLERMSAPLNMYESAIRAISEISLNTLGSFEATMFSLPEQIELILKRYKELNNDRKEN